MAELWEFVRFVGVGVLLVAKHIELAFWQGFLWMLDR
jgi:hypothetical protein